MQESSSFERDEDEGLVRWLKEDLTEQERVMLCVRNDPKYLQALLAEERLRQNRYV